MAQTGRSGPAATEGTQHLECGDWSPLSRGDLSPSDREAHRHPAGRSQFAPARAPRCERKHWEDSTATSRLPKAVTSHRTPNRRARLLVPKGHRRKLAGGKPARVGAAPARHATSPIPQRAVGESL